MEGVAYEELVGLRSSSQSTDQLAPTLMSSGNLKNSVGAMTEPWWTPFVVAAIWERAPLMVTWKTRRWRKKSSYNLQ